MTNEPTFQDESDGKTVTFTADEYTSQWGGDAVYDKAPNERGDDGHLFYNYSDDKARPGFMERFIPAVERTIHKVRDHLSVGDGCFGGRDLENLEKLLRYCRELVC